MHKHIRIGLDIDNVLASFSSHFFKYLELPEHPATDWEDNRIRDNFHLITNDLGFWHSMPAQVHKSEITMPIHCYCTARPIESEKTALWLLTKGFPDAEVRTVGFGGTKVEHLKDVDFFIDDAVHNFEELNAAGINCYLYTQSHNKDYLTDKRCDNLEEFFRIIKNKSLPL
jgi:5'(3')-deoxyribonucleotidase